MDMMANLSQKSNIHFEPSSKDASSVLLESPIVLVLVAQPMKCAQSSPRVAMRVNMRYAHQVEQ
jgi:hypothetical protein